MLDLARLLLCEPTERNLRFGRLVLKVKPKLQWAKIEIFELSMTWLTKLIRAKYLEISWNVGYGMAGQPPLWGRQLWMNPFQKELRTIWLFDSFEGLPPPGEKDGDLERQNYFPGWNTSNVRLVREVFEKIGYPSEKLKIVPGWFAETLIREPIKDIVILHVDADWY